MNRMTSTHKQRGRATSIDAGNWHSFQRRLRRRFRTSTQNLRGGSHGPGDRARVIVDASPPHGKHRIRVWKVKVIPGTRMDVEFGTLSKLR